MADSDVEAFLTEAEEQQVVEAILQAERATSGEIRVHIEPRCPIDPLERAREVFYRLKMDNTKDNNGVLIYVAVKEHKFAIYGGSGINAAVPSGFWNSTCRLIETHFRQKKFKQGLTEGIRMAGEELKKFFPWKPSDTDELSNEISKG